MTTNAEAYWKQRRTEERFDVSTPWTGAGDSLDWGRSAVLALLLYFTDRRSCDAACFYRPPGQIVN